MVEENERTDHLPLRRRQCPADDDAAEVDCARHDQGFDGVDRDSVGIAGFKQRVPRHFGLPVSATSIWKRCRALPPAN
jgi:hypothetical protein